eukprot:361014-Chlamydomonas_euryale.AAC.3
MHAGHSLGGIVLRASTASHQASHERAIPTGRAKQLLFCNESGRCGGGAPADAHPQCSATHPLGHVARMPDESVGWGGVAWSAGHTSCGGIGLQRFCARFSHPGWRCGVGMGWLRTVRNGVPLVTAPCPLLDPVCLAMLNTGITCVGPCPLPVALTLTLTESGHCLG